MKLFIIICMLVVIGFMVYIYKVLFDVAKYIDETIEETLARHDFEFARVHCRIDILEFDKERIKNENTDNNACNG